METTKHPTIEGSISPSNSSARLPVLEFAILSQFDTWLAMQPKSSKGAWLKFSKKSSDVCTISKQDAIDCALCHGWIDGQLGKLDEKHWLIRFLPRTKTSKWSEKIALGPANSAQRGGCRNLASRRLTARSRTDDGMQPTRPRAEPLFQMTCNEPSTGTATRRHSSWRWMRTTVTRCYIAYTTRRLPHPAHRISPNS